MNCEDNFSKDIHSWSSTVKLNKTTFKLIRCKKNLSHTVLDRRNKTRYSSETTVILAE